MTIGISRCGVRKERISRVESFFEDSTCNSFKVRIDKTAKCRKELQWQICCDFPEIGNVIVPQHKLRVPYALV